MGHLIDPDDSVLVIIDVQADFLARALAVEPKVLLLDEPFGALDTKVRKELRRWLRRLHDDMHISSVFVTHDQEEAPEVADRVVVMNHGRIEQVGSPRAVYNAPASEFVARFMGGHNVIHTGAGKLALRNDHLRLDAPAAAVTPLPARVTDVEYQGSYVMLGLAARDAAGDQQLAAMRLEAQYAQRPYALGDPVQLSWVPEQAHLLPA